MSTQKDLEQFAIDFIAYWKLPRTREIRKSLEMGIHPLSFVTDKQIEYINKWPALVLPLIDEVLMRTEDEKIISIVAAGLLEDLLNRYPEQFLPEIERRARQNGAFRACLRNVWPSGIPEKVWKQITVLIR